MLEKANGGVYLRQGDDMYYSLRHDFLYPLPNLRQRGYKSLK